MDDNIFNIFLKNWKTIPIFLRITILSVIIAGVIFSIMFIPSSGNKKVELISETLTDEVKSNVISFLNKEQIPYFQKGGKIFVDEDQKDKILMKLYTANIIPEGADLYKWLFETDITETKEKRNLKLQATLKKRIEQMISNMENIQWAKLEFTPIPTGPFLEDTTQIQPKASLLLKLREGVSLSKKEVQGIAKFVAFAIGNVDPKNITIMDTNRRLYSSDLSDQFLTSEQLEHKLKFEQAIEMKVFQLLSFLSFVSVKANVDVDWSSKTQRNFGIDPEKGAVIKEEHQTQKGIFPTAAGVPGVVTRIPVEENEQPQTTENVSSQTKDVIERAYTNVDVVENIPGGRIKDVSIAVVVSKEELKKSFENPKFKKEEDLLQFAQNELVKTIAKSINIAQEKVVVTPVNLLAVKEEVPVPAPAPVKEKVGFMNVLPLLIGVLIVLAIAFVVTGKKKKIKEISMEEIKKEMEKKEREVPIPTVEEEPIIKEAANIVKASPAIAVTIIKQWVKGK